MQQPHDLAPDLSPARRVVIRATARITDEEFERVRQNLAAVGRVLDDKRSRRLLVISLVSQIEPPRSLLSASRACPVIRRPMARAPRARRTVRSSRARSPGREPDLPHLAPARGAR